MKMENQSQHHPSSPQSNVQKFGGYDPNKYMITSITSTVVSDECHTGDGAMRLTQRTIGKYLQPLTRELVEDPPRPTIHELSSAVIDKMVLRDKAFWVDKPGANAYTLHDAYADYGMTTELVTPNHQDVFPRSYQYDLDCVHYRRTHGCDAFKEPDGHKKPHKAHCRHCVPMRGRGLTQFQLAWAQDPGQRRWRYYPELTASMTADQIREQMNELGRPYLNEACNWYYQNYPPSNIDCIQRKFSK